MREGEAVDDKHGYSGRLIGAWVPPPRPGNAALAGRFVRLEPLEADVHAADLHRAFSADDRVVGLHALWPVRVFVALSPLVQRHDQCAIGKADPVFFALRDAGTGHCGGVASYLRITPEAGSIEVGHICLAPGNAARPGPRPRRCI